MQLFACLKHIACVVCIVSMSEAKTHVNVIVARKKQRIWLDSCVQAKSKLKWNNATGTAREVVRRSLFLIDWDDGDIQRGEREFTIGELRKFKELSNNDKSSTCNGANNIDSDFDSNNDDNEDEEDDKEEDKKDKEQDKEEDEEEDKEEAGQ